MNDLITASLFDTHCHLDFDDFDKDRDNVISRAKQHRVNRILVPSVAQNSWNKTIKTCQQYSNCELALGLHPIFIDQHQPHHLLELSELIEKHHPVAVGEIGLDFYQRELDQEKQLVFFSKQLVIAKQTNLPVIIHNRKAHDQCIGLLKEYDIKGGIIHAFNGSIQQAYKYIELGFMLGFGGMLTFERSNKLRTLANELPLSSIVLETDAPDMTVAQHKGQRNSPEYIPYILNALSAIKQLSTEEVADETTKNANRVLNL